MNKSENAHVSQSKIEEMRRITFVRGHRRSEGQEAIDPLSRSGSFLGNKGVRKR